MATTEKKRQPTATAATSTTTLEHDIESLGSDLAGDVATPNPIGLIKTAEDGIRLVEDAEKNKKVVQWWERWFGWCVICRKDDALPDSTAPAPTQAAPQAALQAAPQAAPATARRSAFVAFGRPAIPAAASQS